MAIRAADVKTDGLGWVIPPQEMLKHINHEEHMVYVERHVLITRHNNKTLRCGLKHFKAAYPQKWQEIQPTLSLQRLKIS